jgi:eukaryotic-like serine/threonine-protein kinase
MSTHVIVDKLIGTAAGNFNITALLGAGGMGRVYHGQHRALGKQVAIKVLSRELAENEELLHRFTAEARTIAQLNHPNIVQVFDFGTLEDGRPFYVMEKLDGENLHQYLQKHRSLSLEHAVSILVPVLSALQAAHEASVIHRDIKPENIFLTIRDQSYVPTLLDFGLAKLLQDASNPHQTETGAVMGTPMYMSPEQALGKRDEINQTADIYAVGALAYQMLTGAPPFVSKYVGELIQMHLNTVPPSLRGLRPDLPAAIADVVDLSLAKSASQRPQSASQVRAVFSAIIKPKQIPIRMLFGGEKDGEAADPSGSTHFAQGTPLAEHIDLAGATESFAAQRELPQLEATQQASVVLVKRESPSEPEVETPAESSAIAQPKRVDSSPVRQSRRTPKRSTISRAAWLLTAIGAILTVGAIVVVITTLQKSPLSGKGAPSALPLAPGLREANERPLLVEVRKTDPVDSAIVAPQKTQAISPPTKSASVRISKQTAPAPIPPIAASAPTAPPASNGGTDAELTQLFRAASDAQMARDYDDALNIYDKILMRAPNNQSARSSAIIAACFAHKTKDAIKHFAHVKDPQVIAAMESACAMQNVLLSPEAGNSAAAKIVQSQTLYEKAVEAVIAKEFAEAAKLFEKAYDTSPNKTDYHAAWRAAENACKSNNPNLVKKVWKRIPERIQKDIVEVCANTGVATPSSQAAPPQAPLPPGSVKPNPFTSPVPVESKP